jgi:hypothetical protein
MLKGHEPYQALEADYYENNTVNELFETCKDELHPWVYGLNR